MRPEVSTYSDIDSNLNFITYVIICQIDVCAIIERVFSLHSVLTKVEYFPVSRKASVGPKECFVGSLLTQVFFIISCIFPGNTRNFYVCIKGHEIFP